MPMPGEKTNRVDLGVTTPWQKIFAWRPIKTVDSRMVWFGWVYRRDFFPDIPTLPYKITQHITPHGLVMLRLQGKA